jgi:hypothetical protein
MPLVHSVIHNRQGRTNKIRSTLGSGLIEGVFGLMLVIGGAVAGTLLILNSGTGISLKQKLVIVTNLAAQYAAQNFNDNNIEEDTQAYVENLLPQVGLRGNGLKVEVTKDVKVATNSAPVTGVQVRVTNQIGLVGNGALFPATIELSDTEFSPNGSSFPTPSGWRLMESEPGATPGFEPVVTGNVIADIASYRAANPNAGIYACPVYDPKTLSNSQLSLPDQ